jgi:hypothetical protein
LSGGGFSESGGVLLKAGDHFVGFKDKGILHLFEAKMAGFDAISILENFTKKGAGARGELMKGGIVLQCSENLGLSESTGGESGSDGVKKHEDSKGKGSGKNRKWRLEKFAKGGKGPGIDDILGPKPTFAGESDAKIEVAKVGSFMGVGVDRAENSEIAGFVPPAPIEVEPPWISVELDPSACGGGGSEDFRDVEGVGFSFEEEAAGGVAEAGDVFVLHGANDAIGHFVFIGSESRMDGGNDVVELR